MQQLPCQFNVRKPINDRKMRARTSGMPRGKRERTRDQTFLILCPE